MNYQNYQNSMRLTSSDTKRALMHLFLFTNSAQRELVSICTHYAEYARQQLTFLALQPWQVRNVETPLAYMKRFMIQLS